jgi:hypothetical protein
MLRQHLRSRSLWSHYANWERKLESIWRLTNQVKEKANRMHPEQSLNKQLQYIEDYVNTALWQGFEMACGNVLKIDYKVPENQLGLSFGAYIIEISAATKAVRDLVEKEHKDFSHEISRIGEMKDLVSLWSDIKELQESILALAMKDLKSSNILYPCRFCRHLWK